MCVQNGSAGRGACWWMSSSVWEEKDPGASAGLGAWLSACRRLAEALNDHMQTLKGPYSVKFCKIIY